MTGRSVSSLHQLQHVEAAQSRQHQIEHHRLRRVAADGGERLLAVGGLRTENPSRARYRLEHVAHDRFVVDHQNGCC